MPKSKTKKYRSAATRRLFYEKGIRLNPMSSYVTITNEIVKAYHLSPVPQTKSACKAVVKNFAQSPPEKQQFFKPTETKKVVIRRREETETVIDYSYLKSKEFLQSREWYDLRFDAFKKYGRQCQCCGAKPGNGVVLHVDHIKPRRYFPLLARDINNLQVLCMECNMGKGCRDDSDFREG